MKNVIISASNKGLWRERGDEGRELHQAAVTRVLQAGVVRLRALERCLGCFFFCIFLYNKKPEKKRRAMPELLCRQQQGGEVMEHAVALGTLRWSFPAPFAFEVFGKRPHCELLVSLRILLPPEEEPVLCAFMQLSDGRNIPASSALSTVREVQLQVPRPAPESAAQK